MSKPEYKRARLLPRGTDAAAGATEVDPLDAFMAEIERETAAQSSTVTTISAKPEIMNHSSASETLLEWKGQLAQQREGEGGGGIAEMIAGSDNGGGDDDASLFLGLEPVNHAATVYEPFTREFYRCHSEILRLHRDPALTATTIAKRRAELEVRVRAPRGVELGAAAVPLLSFAHFGFGARLRVAIEKQGFTTPTPIQAQAIPIVLAGHDVIGIAKTGSGKTLAFGWPLLVHVMAQRVVARGEGPVAAVLEPTRELAEQTYREIKRFAKILGARCTAISGGMSKWEQTKALKSGTEIIVATPGRLIDLVKAKALNLHRITFLVLDEADRMLSMGFGPQVRCIVQRTRPSRQTLFFSATMPRGRIEYLAKEACRNPIRIDVGRAGGQATEHVKHEAVVVTDNTQKWAWLTTRLRDFTAAPTAAEAAAGVGSKLIVFVSTKAGCAELLENLNKYCGDRMGGAAPSSSSSSSSSSSADGAKRGGVAVALHGDMHQSDRVKSMSAFKKGRANVLVATDVAARGLDVKGVRTVVNYDVAKDTETHIHRVGRAGRMSAASGGVAAPGVAFTLVAQTKPYDGVKLVRCLEKGRQNVPGALMVRSSFCFSLFHFRIIHLPALTYFLLHIILLQALAMRNRDFAKQRGPLRGGGGSRSGKGQRRQDWGRGKGGRRSQSYGVGFGAVNQSGGAPAYGSSSSGGGAMAYRSRFVAASKPVPSAASVAAAAAAAAPKPKRKSRWG